MQPLVFVLGGGFLISKSNTVVRKSKDFAVRIIKLSDYLETEKKYVLGKQILKSGTSIGANIHEAIYAQSEADSISKLSISLKEASETEYWIDLLVDSGIVEEKSVIDLKDECVQLIKLLRTIIKTSKERKNKV